MKKATLKIILVLLFLSIAIALRIVGLGEFLSLQGLKTHAQELAQFYDAHPVQVISAYFVIYVFSTALSLPGATVLTLAGGALFGFWTGTLIVSFASTLGATLAFLMTRFIFRDWVRKRFGDRLRKIDEGIKKEGAFYLFTLRLVPLFPFFLVNLLTGLTAMRTSIYFIVSQIGMLPGTAAYVNAGLQLGQIESLKDILSFNILVSFSVLGILPLVSKACIGFYRSSRMLRKFRKPKHFDYNVIVLGGGAAGLVTSYIAAALKSKVALVEKHRMGGDCLNTGCVPSKAFIRSAKVLSLIRDSQNYGLGAAKVSFDFSAVMDRVHRVISKIEPHDSVERYSSLGVHCIQGEARIRTPFEIEVNGKSLATRNIVIATGAKPSVPAIPGLEDVGYFTSDTVWSLRELPQRLLVLGGGPIGCELAQAFSRFGAKVTIVEMAPRLLIREDEDVSEFISSRFRAEGIEILTSHQAHSFSNANGRKILLCKSNQKEVEIEFDGVLLALGRRANVQGFGLEELGVELSGKGTILADDFMRTNYPNIFVCGDVTGPYQFTHVASHQAWYAAVNALFSPLKKFKVDYRVIPWATFTDPEVARVGLNEQEARGQGIDFEVSRYDLADLDRAITEEESHGFIKVLTPPGKDRILGVTAVGAHAGEILAEYVTAMKHGIGLDKILGTIHIYPTFSEANKYVAGVWKRANAPDKVLKILEKFHRWRRGGRLGHTQIQSSKKLI